MIENKFKFNIKRIIACIVFIAMFFSVTIFESINTNAASDVVITYTKETGSAYEPITQEYSHNILYMSYSTGVDAEGSIKFELTNGGTTQIDTIVANRAGTTFTLDDTERNVVHYTVDDAFLTYFNPAIVTCDVKLSTGQQIQFIFARSNLADIPARSLTINGVETETIFVNDENSNDFGTISVDNRSGEIIINSKSDGAQESAPAGNTDVDGIRIAEYYGVMFEEVLDINGNVIGLKYTNIEPNVPYEVDLLYWGIENSMVRYTLVSTVDLASLTKTLVVAGRSTTVAPEPYNQYDFGTIIGGTDGTISINQFRIVEMDVDYPDNFVLDTSTGVVTYSGLSTDVGPIPIFLMFDDGSIATFMLDTSAVSSGGGSSSDAEEDINVFNEENEQNNSSDTTVLPSDVLNNDGDITVELTTKEMEQILEKIEQNATDNPDGTNELIIYVESDSDVKSVTVDLTEEFIRDVVNSDANAVTVSTPIGDFRVKKEEFKNLMETSGGDVTYSIVYYEHEGRPGLDVNLLIGEKTVKELVTPYGVEVRIPYIPQVGEDVNALLIEYIDDENKKYIITESYYDEELKEMVFFLTHLSKYGVAYRAVPFNDVGDTHWAEGTLTYLATRGIITGDANNNFRPNENVTTAEFIAMMTNAFSKADVGTIPIKSYSDVSVDSWYAKEMSWAYFNNISNVIATNNKIYPEADITRENVATITNNVVSGIGILLKPAKDANVVFSDSANIASYAKAPTDAMVKYGIISGTPGGSFLPRDFMTRAEAAKIIASLISAMR